MANPVHSSIKKIILSPTCWVLAVLLISMIRRHLDYSSGNLDLENNHTIYEGGNCQNELECNPEVHAYNIEIIIMIIITIVAHFVKLHHTIVLVWKLK